MWKYRRKVVRGHPYADKRGRVLVHRLALEAYLGRYLLPIELVHHIDEDPSNNQVENLEIVTSAGHGGRHATGVTLLHFQCKTCDKEFSRPCRGKSYTYCSQKCSTRGANNSKARREGHERYLSTIRLLPAERRKRKAARMRIWRAKKQQDAG